MHIISRFSLVFAVCMLLTAPGASAAAESFSQFLDGVRSDALNQGISSQTVSKALSDVAYLPRVIELDRKQPEGTMSFAKYQNNVITQARIDKGRALLRDHKSQLQTASSNYGVPPEVIVALWGMETSYGDNTGGFGVSPALATLAYDGRRSSYFRGELMRALQILDEGHISLENMRGSWAGAMGQNQFMPSSFKSFAVDGNGDGRRDIWTNLPDVFASTANYLSKSGWRYGERWGREVRLPQEFQPNEAGKPIAEWSRLGVTLPDGRTLPQESAMNTVIVQPDGPSGPSFLTYNNYRVIKKWNNSSYFATSVGMLADAVAAGAY
ncbi:MAG: lytic murein transglycosylase [Alphaproteobacteria bacterium]